MGSSFVIATYNRPKELHRCLRSVLGQTVPPDEIVIVDSSDEEVDIGAQMLGAGGITELVQLRAEPWLTRQRNLGVAASSGDPVFFVDDDAELDPNFHAAMLQTFSSGDCGIGGVQATMNDNGCRAWPVRAFKAFFLLTRRTKSAPGRMLPSGHHTIPVDPEHAIGSEVLWTGATAYRRHVLDEFRFDESLDGPCLRDDIDFSYRVSRRYRLVITPDARFSHRKAPGARIDARRLVAMQLVNEYRLFGKNLPSTPRYRAAFAWAMIGTTLLEITKSAATGRAAYLLGLLDGLREIRRLARTTTEERLVSEGRAGTS
ncbi:MAG: glycosyltransferase family 2 protein [Actinomycetota bacterium]